MIIHLKFILKKQVQHFSYYDIIGLAARVIIANKALETMEGPSEKRNCVWGIARAFLMRKVRMCTGRGKRMNRWPRGLSSTIVWKRREMREG